MAERSKRRRWRRRSIGGLGVEMARRSSNIYPINRFELSNRGSEDRSNTYIDNAHGLVYECTPIIDKRSYGKRGSSVM